MKDLFNSKAKIIGLIVAVLVLLVMPPLYSSYWVTLLTQMLIFAILAMSLDILVGYSGLSSFGHAGFFGVAGYTVAILSTRYKMGFLYCLISGVSLSVLISMVFGFLVAHATGVYFLIITLALGMVLWGLAFRWVSMTGGDNGISGIMRPDIGLPIAMKDPLTFYYVMLGFFLIALILMAVLVRSPFGHSLKGVRESESRMRVLGYQHLAAQVSVVRRVGGIRRVRGRVLGLFQRVHQPLRHGPERVDRDPPDGHPGRTGNPDRSRARGRDHRISQEFYQRLYPALAAHPRNHLYPHDPVCPAGADQPPQGLAQGAAGEGEGVRTEVGGWGKVAAALIFLPPFPPQREPREGKGEANGKRIDDPAAMRGGRGVRRARKGKGVDESMGSTETGEKRTSDPCLVLKDLSIDFGGLRAVDGVNLTIEQGERRVLMGPNGAGKTTLFNLISGIYPPSAGRIFYFGKDISRYPIYRRAALGIARTYQVTNLFKCLTVAENILMACQALDRTKFVMFRPLSSYQCHMDRCDEVLKEFDLWDRRGELVKNLSHGDQRRIEVAMALAEKPRLLLLDEPAAGLSSAETQDLTALLKKLDPSITVVLIEHDLDVAFEFAERITVLYQGKFLTEGTKEEIKGNPTVHEIYLGAE